MWNTFLANHCHSLIYGILVFLSYIGYDDVDLVLTPHIAGVVVKSELAGLSSAEIAARSKKREQERIADLTIDAFERGLKKRKKKKENDDKKLITKDKADAKK